MPPLNKIGLDRKSPAEIVLTTFGPNGIPHASTVGMKASGKSKVMLRVFTDTETFRNLVESKAAVVNIVRDVRLLAALALKALLKFDERKLSFMSSKYVNAPRLKAAEAYVEIEVKNLRMEEIFDELGKSEVAHIETEIKHIEAQTSHVQPFKRSESFVIESAVLATKVLETMKKGKVKTGARIFREIVSYEKKCRLVASDSEDCRVISKIVSSLARRFDWRG